MSRQQAGADQRYRDELNRQNRARQEADNARANARNDAQRMANQRAADASHARTMETIRRAGQNTWTPNYSPDRSSRPEQYRASSGGGSRSGGKSGAGLLLAVLVIGGVIIAANSGSRGSRSGGSDGPSTFIVPQQSRSGPDLAKPSPQVTEQNDQPVTPAADNLQAAPAPSDSAPAMQDQPTAQPASPTTENRPAYTVPSATPNPYATPAPASAPADELDPLDKVAAVYPNEARQAGVVGKVFVLATVSPVGDVVNVVPQNGNPALMPAAQAAAYKWKFAPYPARADGMLRKITLAFDFGT